MDEVDEEEEEDEDPSRADQFWADVGILNAFPEYAESTWPSTF